MLALNSLALRCFAVAALAATAHATAHAIAGASAGASAPPLVTTATLFLRPCKVQDAPSLHARCGALDVPENPHHPESRHLAIHVMVIPAEGAQALPDPIVPLMGGPGEDAISGAADFAQQFARLRKDRDLLLVDQRGTGQSGALRCNLGSDPAALLRDVFPLAAVKECEQALSAGADLTQYSYAHFANDLEQIRRALGYQSLNLFAGSYGTRAAQVFLRAFPASVRTAYLGSVVPIDIAIPGPFAATSQAMLEKTLDACAADTDCKAAFPNLRAEFAQVAARLAAGKARVLVPGTATPATLSRGRVAEWFRSLLYRPRTAAQLPWLIHQAYLGNWQPIADGIVRQMRQLQDTFSFGLLFSITCTDDVPFVREEDIQAEMQTSFLGDYRVRQQQAACSVWPKSPLPPGYREPIVSSVPTLFVSGDLDGNTPLWFMEHARKGFSPSGSMVEHGQGHTEWNDCVARVYETAVRTASPGVSTALVCPTIPRPPFKTK